MNSTHALPTNVNRTLTTMFLDSNGQNLLERYLQYIVGKILNRPNIPPSAYRFYMDSDSVIHFNISLHGVIVKLSLDVVWQELVDLAEFAVSKYNLHIGASNSMVNAIKLFNADSFTENMPDIVGGTIRWNLSIVPPQSQRIKWSSAIGDIPPFDVNLCIKIVETHTMVYNAMDPSITIPSPSTNYSYVPPKSSVLQLPNTYTQYVESSFTQGGFHVGKF